MTEERGTWEAILHVLDGIEHTYAVAVDATAEAAVQAAMARAVAKYGPQDWARWRIRAEWCNVPVLLRTVCFEWRDGALRHLHEGGHHG
jgi:hypothetical protein